MKFCFHRFLLCVCGTVLNITEFQDMDEESKKWNEIVKKLKLPFDDSENRHTQFDDHKSDMELNISEGLLLDTLIPMKNIKRTTRKNNLEFAESTLGSTTPLPMHYGLATIASLKLGDAIEAENNLRKSFENYLQGPFNVWSSSPNENDGIKHYLPGAASLLQTILTGYGGLKLHVDRLEFLRPTVPNTSVTGLTFSSINYLGNIFRMEVTKSKTTIYFKSVNTNRYLTLVRKIIDDNGNEEYVNEDVCHRCTCK